MENLIDILSLEDFEKATQEKSIFMFTAGWCPDCVFVKPFIGQIVSDNPEFKFYKIDRDQFIDLCKDLDIMGIPSFVAYDKGVETGRFVSKLRKTKQEIQNFIDSVK
ncbi:MAG: thioredoxin family protein [Beduini sp.]|uniref:thioredoxin family protein n=1 Tax=Beduini sp. TaxID=1922300 RepID=UPI0011C74FCE